MKLRIGPELRRQLAIVKLHGFSAADAVNCAARRWERYGKPELGEVETGTTYGGTVATVDPPAGMDAGAVRSRQARAGERLQGGLMVSLCRPDARGERDRAVR